MYLHERFRVLTTSPWKEAIFGKGARKLRITGLVFKKPRLLPIDHVLIQLSEPQELDELLDFANKGSPLNPEVVAAFKAVVR